MTKARARHHRLTVETDIPNPIDKPTPFHKALLALFDRYDYLPWPWLHALHPMERNAAYFRQQCERMMRKPNRLLELPDGQIAESGLHLRHAIYARTGKERAGFDPHNLLINQIRAALELACRKRGYRLVQWKDAIEKPRVDPLFRKYIKKQKAPHVPLKFTDDGTTLTVLRSYNPDDCLIIDYGKDRPAELRFRYLFIEADRGNQPYDGDDDERHKYLKDMFEQMAEIERRKLFKEHWGFESALFLFVLRESDRRQLQPIIDNWERDYKRPCSFILFQSVPNWMAKPEECPLGDALWKLAGLPDFDLMEPPSVRT